MGTPPPGYNASDSLLSGGTEQIVAVMGGGKPAKKRKTRVKKKKSRSKKSLKGGGNYILKSHASATSHQEEKESLFMGLEKIDLTKIPLQRKPKNWGDWTEAEATKYVAAQKALWTRKGPGAATLITTDNSADTKYAQATLQIGNTGSDRLYYIINEDVTEIHILPPVNGSIENFHLAYEYVYNTIMNNPKQVYIFAPPFYSAFESHINTNLELFKQYVMLKNEVNKYSKEHSVDTSIHILTDYSNGTISVACHINRELGKKGDEALIVMYEPTYILYPRTTLINGIVIGGLLLSGAAMQNAETPEKILPESNPPGSGALSSITKNDMNPHAFKPNVSIVEPAWDRMKNPYRSYRFLGDGVRLDLDSNKVNKFTISTTAEGINDVPEVEKNPKFIPGDTVFRNGVTETDVQVGSSTYKIRKTGQPEVAQDWRNGAFTNGEAEFLNDLNLRPAILEDMYKDKGTDWKEELVNFLTTVGNSECFTDYDLVLNSDCQRAQKFIEYALNWFIENDTRITTLESEENNAEFHRANQKIEEQASQILAHSDITGLSEEQKNADIFTTESTHGLTRLNNPKSSTIDYTKVFYDNDKFQRHILVIDTYKKTQMPANFARVADSLSSADADFRKWYSGIKTNPKYKKYMFLP